MSSGGGPIEQATGRRIEIDDALLQIEHEHAIGQVFDQHAARDRGQIEQAEAVQTGGKEQARHGKSQGR